MSKNIVLCCDGTSNQFAGDQTNVIKLYRCLLNIAGQQLTFYDPGVGTQPAPGLWFGFEKRVSVLLGLAIGLGFKGNIRDAYCFLMENYEPGDKVYLFGFSRGAFTARAVAGMIHAVGLLRPGTDNLIPYAMSYWRKSYTPEGAKIAADFKRTLARECKIHFVGVWDTVGSVGWLNNFQTFPYTRHNPDVEVVRHAVSMDERRCCFRQNLMEPEERNTTQDFKNVWFAGVHADVGGGYPEMEGGLSKLSLKWMAREAALQGAQIDPNMLAIQLGEQPSPSRTLHAVPDPKAQLHRSLKGAWWLLEMLPRKQWNFKDRQMHWAWGPSRPRWMAQDPLVHQSVEDRKTLLPEYRPVNLPAAYQVVN